MVPFSREQDQTLICQLKDYAERLDDTVAITGDTDLQEALAEALVVMLQVHQLVNAYIKSAAENPGTLQDAAAVLASDQKKKRLSNSEYTTSLLTHFSVSPTTFLSSPEEFAHRRGLQSFDDADGLERFCLLIDALGLESGDFLGPSVDEAKLLMKSRGNRVFRKILASRGNYYEWVHGED